MDAQNRANRDRLIALGFVSLLLVIMYGPAAGFFVGVDRITYDQLAGRLVARSVSDGIIITINPQGKSATEVREDFTRILARVRTHDARRIVLPQPPDVDAATGLPEWTQALRDGPPVFLPSGHPLAALSAGTGYLDVRPDPDGTLRRSNLWFLSGGQMTPSLPLAIALASSDALPAANIARSDAEFYIGGYRPLPRLRGEDLLSGSYTGADLRGKTVFLDSTPELIAATARLPSGQYVTPSELVATMLGGIESGTAITVPGWAGAAEIIVPAVLAVLAILLLPSLNRASIVVTTLLVVAALLLAEAVLLVALHMRVDLGRPIVVFISASLLSMWLSGTSSRRAVTGNALRRGCAFLAAGRLEPAFAEFRRCNPTTEVANAMYKLSMAFEEQAQPERAEAVLTWLEKAQTGPADIKRAALPETPAHNEQTRRPPVADDTNPASSTGANALMQTTGIPRELGRYVIERKIGRGAMGAVYLARDPRINRDVALKIIPIEKEFEDEELQEARERFFLEAESAGRLAHPYIITVYDCGEDKHLAYIAMEYLQGTSLTFFKAQEKLLAPRKALELCARTAEGLDYAHNQGVIHRDIKPANLLYNAREDILKISDFGVARLTDNNRTKTGIVLGTPMYMSPEQLSAEELTGHSDLFSLGVTLYELLTGEVPFKATNIAVLMKKITTEDPQPIAGRRPGIPPSVDAVLFRMLEKRPENRFANGAELAVALRNCAKYAST